MSSHAETELIKAEAVYTLKRAQYPDAPGLEKMAEVIGMIIGFTTQSVNLDDEHLEVSSEYAQQVKNRMTGDVREVLNSIIAEHSAELSDALIKAQGPLNASRECSGTTVDSNFAGKSGDAAAKKIMEKVEKAYLDGQDAADAFDIESDRIQQKAENGILWLLIIRHTTMVYEL